MGGIAGLLGAGAIRALAGRLPEAAQFWTILGLALACLGAGAVLAGRVFAFDWARLLTLPDAAAPRARGSAEPHLPFKPRAASAARSARAARRRSTTRRASRPRSPTRRQPPRPRQDHRQGRQEDLFDSYELPSLDLLADPPADTAPKIDKLALERNARLLETVLDDFNVKGEITAVRTGPVVTMYELEPAPGIKASRVIGLAEDIARNMSAISRARLARSRARP